MTTTLAEVQLPVYMQTPAGRTYGIASKSNIDWVFNLPVVAMSPGVREWFGNRIDDPRLAVLGIFDIEALGSDRQGVSLNQSQELNPNFTAAFNQFIEHSKRLSTEKFFIRRDALEEYLSNPLFPFAFRIDYMRFAHIPSHVVSTITDIEFTIVPPNYYVKVESDSAWITSNDQFMLKAKPK